MRADAVVATVAMALFVGLLAFGGPATQRWDGRRAMGDGTGDADREEDEVPIDVAGAPGMRFGLDAASIDEAQAHGVTPDYGTLWVGPWTLQWGWREPDATLDALVAANVTPAVHLYYWGDAIHHDCFTVGCAGRDVAGWDRLAAELAQHLGERLQGRPALVILETEFNKHQVKDDEDLDALLAAKAQGLKSGYPAATVVLGLGNWFPEAWGTWDRAAAASDAIGLQALSGSTRDTRDHTLALPDRLLDGVRHARELWGKPVVVHDVAVSSYPEPTYLDTQEEVLRGLVDGMDDLRAMGVEAVIYRSFLDVPTMPLGEHFGEAERHWGLAWRDTGELKPAGVAWVSAMKATRGL